MRRGLIALGIMAGVSQIGLAQEKSTGNSVDGSPRFALTATAMRLEEPFAILHAPAHFVDLIIAYLVAQ